MMNKMLMIALVVFGVIIGIQQVQKNRLMAENTNLLFKNDSLVQLNDSTVAMLAHEKLDKESVQEELRIAKDMNATLVATARIKAKPDTVYRDRTQTQVVTVGDSAAHVRDSTEVGVLDADIYVASDPFSIDFSYVFKPNPIDVRISLLQTRDNQAIFLATYSGGTSEVAVPYADLVPKPKRLSAYLQGGYGSAWLVRGGGAFRLFGKFHVFAELEKRFSKDFIATLGDQLVPVSTGDNVDFFFGFMQRF